MGGNRPTRVRIDFRPANFCQIFFRLHNYAEEMRNAEVGRAVMEPPYPLPTRTTAKAKNSVIGYTKRHLIMCSPKAV